MSAAAEGGGVTLGTMLAVAVALAVGLAVGGGVVVAGAVGELGADVEGDAVPPVPPGVWLVAGVDVVALGVAGDEVGGVVGATVGRAVGGGVLPVLRTNIARPVPDGVLPKTIICPEVGDWWTLVGLTGRVATWLALRSNGAQPAGALVGHTSLTSTWRTTIEPSFVVLTHATSLWGTGIAVGTRFDVAVGTTAMTGVLDGAVPMSMFPSRKPTTITAAIDPRAPMGAQRPRGNATTVPPARWRAGRDRRRPPPARACSASSAVDVRAHRSRGGGITRIARRYSRSLW
jgi:hypothetical protein